MAIDSLFQIQIQLDLQDCALWHHNIDISCMYIGYSNVTRLPKLSLPNNFNFPYPKSNFITSTQLLEILMYMLAEC